MQIASNIDIRTIAPSAMALRTLSDAELVKAIARHDQMAMEELYSRHQKRVCHFVLRIVRDATLAEDLASHVFLDVWRSASQFEGRSQVSTWLLSIARFKALTALRQRRHEDIDQREVLDIADDRETPEISLDRSMTGNLVRRCLEKLSPAHRQIIDLVYYHDMSVDEVARMIGIPANTVKTRMFYARRHLANHLHEAGLDMQQTNGEQLAAA